MDPTRAAVCVQHAHGSAFVISLLVPLPLSVDSRSELLQHCIKQGRSSVSH
jgi:hypothetical protein